MIPFPNKKYQIIYADPPWKYGDKVLNNGHGGKFDGLDLHYPTMPTSEICEIPVQSITDENCALFLWSTDSHLPDALEVIKHWGFKYITVAFYWLKMSRDGLFTKSNLGKWTQKNIEICLFATKGKMSQYLQDRTISQLIECPRLGHSKKPAETKCRIVKLLGDLPRIELFARTKTDGWDVWGNEVNTDPNAVEAVVQGAVQGMISK